MMNRLEDPSQFSTNLNDRILRFDGVSIVHPDLLEDMILRGAQPKQLRVAEITAPIEQFNSFVPDLEKIAKHEPEKILFDKSWVIPTKYLNLDIEEHVSAVFCERLINLKYDSVQTEAAINRVALELKKFKEFGLYDLLKTIIYVLDMFRENKQIWGVGRGSSCASFVLFILGLHVVDPIKFDISINEFFHEEPAGDSK